MSGESIIRFLILEVVIICVMLLAVWGVKKMAWDAEPTKYVTMMIYVIFGGAALLAAMRFAGVW